jgi:hypothetical protein
MKLLSRVHQGFLVLLMMLVFARMSSQTICNPAGDLMIFTNYDGGTLTINVDQNIANLRIGICSYEAVNVVLTGAFVNNVVAVRYAGYNSANNSNCSGGTIPTTTISGAPGTATTSIVFAPPSPLANSNGYGSIICGYSCNNNTTQGGCNTVDQVEAYFLTYFSGSILFAHKVQYGCWTGTQSVSVGGNCCPPVTVIAGSVTASQSICAGATPSALVSYSPASSGTTAVTYTWQVSTTSSSSGFSNITGANAAGYSPGALSATTYYRRAASTSTNNVVYTNVIAITVSQPPIISISGPTVVCAGTTNTYNASGAATYTWFPQSLLSSSVLIVATVNSGYTVGGTSAAGCTNSAIFQIQVHQSPVVTANSNVQQVCEGGTVSLTGFGSSSYTWDPGNLVGNPVTVTPSVNTTYTLTGTDLNGCSAIAVVPIGIIPLPVIGINMTSTTVCSGKTATLTGSGATNYTWLPGGTVGSAITITPAATATYTLVGFDGACTGSATQVVGLIPNPTVTAVASQTRICRGESSTLTAGGAQTYFWSNGASTATAIVSPSVSISYSVNGVAANGCINAASVAVSVSVCDVGITETSPAYKSLNIYPNPSKGDFTISSFEIRNVEIYDCLGAQVKVIVLNQESKFEAQISLPPGVYFAVSRDGGRDVARKIVVMK